MDFVYIMEIQMGGHQMKNNHLNGLLKKMFSLLFLVTIISVFMQNALHVHADADVYCNGDHTSWTPLLPTGGVLPTGNYYLTENVRLTQNITISTGTVNLDLNGHILWGATNADTSVITVTGGTLNLSDCNSGNLVHNYKIKEVAPNSSQDMYYNNPNATNKLFQRYYDFDDIGDGVIVGGIITGGHKFSKKTDLRNNFGYSGGGSAILIGGNSGTVNFYGGTISGNTVTTLSQWGSKRERSGAIGVKDGGTLNFYEGQIVGNSSRFHGAAIYAFGSSSVPARVNLYGGIIKDNYSFDGPYNYVPASTLTPGGAAINTDNPSAGSSIISLSGDPQITDNYHFNFASNNYLSTNMSYSTETNNSFRIVGKLYTEQGGIKTYARIGLWGGGEAGNQLTVGYTTQGNTHEEVNKIFFSDDITKAAAYNTLNGEIKYVNANLKTLTYYANNETANSSLLSVVDKISVSNSMFSYIGHTFSHWNTSADDTGISYAPNDIITLTGNQALYAIWTKSQYQINYWMNGGVFNTSVGTNYTYGNTVDLPVPIWTDKVFDGWYDNALLTGSAITKINASDYGNKTYYAKWTGIEYYTITSTAGANGLISPAGSIIYNGTQQDYVISPMNGFKISSFTVNGVDLKSEIINNRYVATDITSDTQINVAFEKIESSDITIYSTSGENGSISMNGYYVVSSGSNVTYTMTPNPGYRIKDVSVNGHSVGVVSSYTLENVTSNQMVHVEFMRMPSIVSWPVTLNYNEGIYQGAYVLPSTYVEGIGMALPTGMDINRDHYIFEGWFDNAEHNGSAITSITPSETGAKEYWAKWSIKQYTATFKDHDDTTITTSTVDYMTSAVAPGHPTRTGYTFVGWDATFDQMTANISVKAIYSINSYTITFNSNGGSDVTSITQEYQSTVNEPQVPTKPNHTFGGWYIDNELTSLYTFETIPSVNITLYAKWDMNLITGISSDHLYVIYDGLPHSIEVDGLLPGDTISYKTLDEYESINPTFISVTDFVIVYYRVSREDFFDYEGFAVLKISKANISNVDVNGYSGIYDGEDHEAIIDQYATITNDQTAEWKYKTAPDAEYTQNIPSFQDVGSYTVYYKITALNHHDYTGSFKVIITRMNIQNATIILGPTLTYNGQEQTQTIISVMIDQLIVTYDISGNSAIDHSIDGYTLKVNGKGNFSGEVNVSWNIEQIHYDLSSISFMDKTVKANVTVQQILIEGSLPNGVTVHYENNDHRVSGIYEVVAKFSGDPVNYYAIEDMHATLTILISQFIERTEDNTSSYHDVEVISDSGFDTNLELSVVNIPHDAIKLEIDQNDKIVKAYDIQMTRENQSVDVTTDIIIKLLIPNEAKDEIFSIYHEQEKVNYTIDGDYAVILTNHVSEFVFVIENIEKMGSLTWLNILLSIFILVELGLIGNYFLRNKKQKSEIRLNTFTPFIILLIIPSGQIVLAIVLFITFLLLGLYSLYLYVPAVNNKFKQFVKVLIMSRQPKSINKTADLKEIMIVHQKPTQPQEVEQDDEDELEMMEINQEKGLKVLIQYRRSFMAKLIQTSDETKTYYINIRNALLSYKNVKSSVSWNHDSIKIGRQRLAIINIRGKNLYVHLALQPEDFQDSKYRVEQIESKKYTNLPLLYKINGKRKAKYALDLIELLAKKFELIQGELKVDHLVILYETTEALIKKGLIKELIPKDKYEHWRNQHSLLNVDVKNRKIISASEVDRLLDDASAQAMIIKKKVVKSHKKDKAIVNIDTISAHFQEGDIINLESLKEKGLFSSRVDYYKVLSRGQLDKALTIEANDFSLEAVKMILLAGGIVVQITE